MSRSSKKAAAQANVAQPSVTEEQQVIEAPEQRQTEQPAPGEAQTTQAKSERIHDMMSAAIQQAASIEAGVQELAKKRGAGVYAVLTLCAATDAQTFEPMWNRVKTEMGADVNGCATKAGLKKSAKTGAFKIPSSASSAASTLQTAIEWGITLADVNTGAPYAFNKIREAVNEERAKRMEAGANDVEKALFKCRAALAVAVGQLAQIATAKLETGEYRISDRIDTTMLFFIEAMCDNAIGFSVAYAPPEEAVDVDAPDADDVDEE